MLDHPHRSIGFTISSHGRDSWDWRALHREALAVTRRVLRDEGKAEDAAQEALVRAWRYAHSCDDATRPGPWLRTIAHREALREIARTPAALPTAELPEIADTTTPTGDVDGIVVRATVAEQLGALERELVHYRYWLGYSDREIAATTDLPIGTVKTKLHRARGALRPALAGV
jgi:RNA polymerase sigma-70 factor (ECF subfamily)